MKAWSQFYPYVQPKVPGVVLPTIDFQLRLAAQEWCEKTLCWRDTLDPVTTNGVDRVYDFNVDLTQLVVQILGATLDGNPLDVLSIGDMPSNWRTSDACDKAIFGLFAASQFAVVPLQSTGLSVITEVALMPSNTATGVTDEIFARYVKHIARGALAELQPQGGHREAFENAINEVASEVSHSFGNGPARVRASFL